MQKTAAIILAAGDGTRMKSKKPKVLCEVLFRPMISWVASACREAGIENVCVVTGENDGEIMSLLPEGFSSARQLERRGTGHAAMMAADFLRSGGYEDALVLNGDNPLIDPSDVKAAFADHKQNSRAVTVLTARVDEPFGYGRIVREQDEVKAIVEQNETDEKTAGINEINSGLYCFNAKFLLEFFANMTADNKKGEYYLTDSVAYAVKTGVKTGAHVISDADTALGANSRGELAVLNAIARHGILAKHMQNGVNIPFYDGIIIGPEAQIATDTTILPGTIIRGKTIIGENCEIGPNSYLENAIIGDGCRVLSTYIESSELESGVKIGPMSNVRPGCRVGKGAKIGDFVEIKNSNIGQNTAVAHLTYIGDSDVGASCNFGCGVVTVNYDGANKHRTSIGDGVFIGCNTNLIAPVRMGDHSYSAAGTTVTEDVPEGALVIGRARQVVKEERALGKFKKYK